MAAAAWVRFPVSAMPFFFGDYLALFSAEEKKNEARGIRTPNLWVWNPTRCHCAIASWFGGKIASLLAVSAGHSRSLRGDAAEVLQYQRR